MLNGETFVMAAPLASPGSKLGALRQIEAIDGLFGKPAYRWVWEVLDGEEAGREVAKTTGTELRRGNSFGNLVEQLFDREIAPGESVDISKLIDQPYDLLLVAGRDGSGAVLQSVKPASTD